MTKLTLPLHYSVRAKPYRHRDPSHINLVDFVSVDVPEVSESDAPEVVALHADEAVETLRWHDGRFWMVDVADDPERMSLRGFVGGFLRKHDKNPSYFQNLHWRYHIPSSGTVVEKTVESERCREVTFDDRAAKLADLHQKVDRELAFIGGVLHVSVPEPFVILVKDNVLKDESYFRSVCFGDPREKGHFLNPSYGFGKAKREIIGYSLSQAEEADHAEAFLVACGVEVKRLGTVEALECHAEAEYSDELRMEGSDVVKTAEEALADVRYKMPDWPTEDAMKWFALRDTIGPSESDASPEDVVEALEGLAEIHEIGPWARLQVERWLMRPLDAGLAFK